MSEKSMDHYKLSAKYYDATYSFKNYKEEAGALRKIINARKKSGGNELLEVACGTGLYIEQFKEDYKVSGVDVSPSMLALVRKKFPELSLLEGDMRNFHLSERFDVILCLFSSIAYLYELDDWRKTLLNFYTHLKPGGVAIVETFIREEIFIPNHYSALNLELPDCKLSRHNASELKGNLVYMDMHTLVSSANSVVHFQEDHVMRVHTINELKELVKTTGFEIEILENGLQQGRDLLVFVKPSS